MLEFEAEAPTVCRVFIFTLATVQLTSVLHAPGNDPLLVCPSKCNASLHASSCCEQRPALSGTGSLERQPQSCGSLQKSAIQLATSFFEGGMIFNSHLSVITALQCLGQDPRCNSCSQAGRLLYHHSQGMDRSFPCVLCCRDKVGQAGVTAGPTHTA